MASDRATEAAQLVEKLREVLNYRIIICARAGIVIADDLLVRALTRGIQAILRDAKLEAEIDRALELEVER